MDRPKILVVDDEKSIRDLLSAALGQWGYQAFLSTSGPEALGMLKGQLLDAALIDIRMPDMDGIELLRELKRYDSSMEVVIMTGYPTVTTAVEALKEGAYDYLTKPLIMDELKHLLARLIERRFLRKEVNTLRSRLGEQLAVNELVGVSPQMQAVKEVVAKVAVSDSPVMVEGESGTGKELVAAAIHRLSPRTKGAFIPVNCSAIPTDLLETEVRPVGATKTHNVDVRVIAATNRQLEEALKDGSLRQDLFYRLNVVRVQMPPLRERKEDIPALVAHFLRQFNQRFRREVTGLDPEALAALMAYDFPGNVRELENLIERAYALGARDHLTLADLPSLGAGAKQAEASRPLPTLAEVEK